MAEANIKASLSIESEEALKKIVKIRQELKATTELLAKAESGGHFDSGVAEKYALEIEKLNIALKDAGEEFGKVSEKASKFESFKDVLSGIQGGFGAITGTLSLFGEKSEVVEEALEKVKAGLEITEGISSLGKAAAAFKALGLAISETGVGIILVVLTGLVALFKSLSESVDETTKAQKNYNDVVKAAEGDYKVAIANVIRLQAEIAAAGNNLTLQKVALEDYNKTVGTVNGQITAFADLQTKMASDEFVQKYVKAMLARATATAAIGKAADANVKIFEAQDIQSKLLAEEIKEFNELQKHPSGGAHPFDKGNEIRKRYEELHAVQNAIIKDAQADLEQFQQIAIDSTKEAEKNTQESGVTQVKIVKNTQDSVHNIKEKSLKQQLDDQLASYDKQQEADLNVAEDLKKGEEEKYNIQKRYQELKIQALEQYYATLNDKTSQQAFDIRNQVTAIVNEGIALDEKHIKAIFDAADAEIKKDFEAFKPPAEVKLPEPKTPEQIQKEKDKADADANDEKAGQKIHEKQDAFNKANPKDENKSPYKKQLEDLESFYKETSGMVKKDGENELKLKQYYSEEKKKLKKLEVDYELGLTTNLLSQASDLFGKNTVAGKVTAIAAATINTYLGATKALATLPPPFSYVSAAITVAAGIKSIQSIINTKVPGASSSGGVVSSAPTAPVLPEIQQTNTTLNSNQLNQIGNATVRAFVLESDVSNNQEKIARLNRAARLGG